MKRTTFAWLAMLAVMFFPAVALAQQADKEDDEKKADAPAAAASDEEDAPVVVPQIPMKLRTYKLQHRTPTELKALLALLPKVAGEATGTPTFLIKEAVDNRRKLLFVRAQEKDLVRIDAAVKALDVSDEDLTTLQIEGLSLHPLKHVSADVATTVLSQLGLGTKVIKIGEITFLMMPDDEEICKEILEVLAEVDTPAPEPVETAVIEE